MPIDAIQEFSSEQNPKAEYGFRDGSVVNVGHQVRDQQHSRHGLRIWARCQRDGCGQLLHRARLPRQPWSSSARQRVDPIIKDKLFWFAGFEGLRVDRRPA